MSSDSQKILTVLEMLAFSLESMQDVARVQRWIEEQREADNLPGRVSGKEAKQALADARRALLQVTKQIEFTLRS